MKIEVFYHDLDLPKLEQIEKGNWIDLRVSSLKYQVGNLWKQFDLKKQNVFKYTPNSFMLFNLGISMNIGDMEAHVVPRSSTYNNYGLIQTNHMGVIDSTYCGAEDIWFWPCLSMRKGQVEYGDRICQFRLIEPMGKVNIIEVQEIKGKNRGGFGSSGVK